MEVSGDAWLGILRLARFSLVLRAEDTLLLPPYKGSTLRGGFGGAFRRVACSRAAGPPGPRGALAGPQAGGQPGPGDALPDCHSCPLGTACPYAYVFETAPPPGSQVLRKYRDVPRPFVLEPPPETRETYGPGERLALGLVLVGRGVDYLPYFVVAFKELGQWGLGRRGPAAGPGAGAGRGTGSGAGAGRAARGRFALEEVRALEGPSDRERTLWSEGPGRLEAFGPTLTGADVLAEAQELPAGDLAVEFLTMTRLRYERQLVDRPVFHVLVRSLLHRLSALLYFHHGHELALDFRGLLERAAAVQLVEDRTRWEDWERYSSRQDARMKLGGIVGRAVYRGPVGEFLPLLVAGSYLHVGKGATFGLGRYRLATA